MKVGDYVRTKKGIEKITYLRESMTLGGYEKYMTTDKRAYKNLTDFAGIIKSSPNIIDLIEVGDYVNGYKVISLWKDKTKVIGVAVDSSVIGFDECEIKSIITKEQFESMEYKVGE